jgi:hypothetical protein
MCAKFGWDRFRNMNLYKVQTFKQTNKQTYRFIYNITRIWRKQSWHRTASSNALQCLLQVFEGYRLLFFFFPFWPSARKFEHLFQFKIRVQFFCLPLHVFKSDVTVIWETCLWDSSTIVVQQPSQSQWLSFVLLVTCNYSSRVRLFCLSEHFVF